MRTQINTIDERVASSKGRGSTFCRTSSVKHVSEATKGTVYHSTHMEQSERTTKSHSPHGDRASCQAFKVGNSAGPSTTRERPTSGYPGVREVPVRVS
jgi:hypothetical protein